MNHPFFSKARTIVLLDNHYNWQKIKTQWKLLHKCELSQACNKRVKKLIGQQIRKRRKELQMSVDELAQRIGKDRSTIYRYENGAIGNMPLEMLLPLSEALETTPQELLSTTISSNEWLSTRAKKWFEATDRHEFNDKEVKLFHIIADYIMSIQNSEDYEENINFLFTLFKHLNKE